MPQLRVRGISAEQMAAVSTDLVQEMGQICECGEDNFTIDVFHVTSVFGGRTVETYPFIEVAWFERGKEIRDRLAACITKHVQSQEIAEVEVAFTVYREEEYYVNGLPCG
ncbi:DUF1904 family protein [Paenibacillus gansuensis]|uniref:DUF1904 family protein n=1 Tax=Paenibacillus gansuensis TaxID=306542 RepID=A0ABW5PHP5_9BACL